VCDDWLQDVLTRLLEDDGRRIRSFRGTDDNSAYAFLASVAKSRVQDCIRSLRADCRNAPVVSFDAAVIATMRKAESGGTLPELLDAERLLSDHGGRNSKRDLLIFHRHFIEGFTAAELAAEREFNLTLSGMEKAISRLRSRLHQIR
jgi:hypothetical protein